MIKPIYPYVDMENSYYRMIYPGPEFPFPEFSIDHFIIFTTERLNKYGRRFVDKDFIRLYNETLLYKVKGGFIVKDLIFHGKEYTFLSEEGKLDPNEDYLIEFSTLYEILDIEFGYYPNFIIIKP